jgi:hypothetical protein
VVALANGGRCRLGPDVCFWGTVTLRPGAAEAACDPKRTCSEQRSPLNSFPRAGRHPLAPRIAEPIRVSLRCLCSRASPIPHPPRLDWKGSGRVPSFGAKYLFRSALDASGRAADTQRYER